MNKQVRFFLYFSILLAGCSRSPVIIQQGIEGDVRNDVVNASHWVYYYPQYIGAETDTIVINPNFDPSAYLWHQVLFPFILEYSLETTLSKTDQADESLDRKDHLLARVHTATDKNMTIFVDTTQTIYTTGLQKGYESSYKKAYPVILKNISNDLVSVGFYKNNIPLKLEACDKSNYWLDVEGLGYFPESLQDRDDTRIMLLPRSIIVTGVMRYAGDIYTKLRLSYVDIPMITVYSNEFYGFVNQRDLDRASDDNLRYHNVF